MKFSKMQGLGNDYIYVDCLRHTINNVNETAKFLSDRHFGIGSDGLVLICLSDKADFKMDMYNSDGSQAEMCGNAIRCVGKYVYDRNLTTKRIITIETLAGIKTLELNITNNKVQTVRVNMGCPILTTKDIPVISELDKFIQQSIIVDSTKYKVTCISMGNPHAVTFVDNVDTLEIEKIGPKFENHKMFPKRINTEFAQIIDNHTVKMRVWERGACETLACGTGACATMAACSLLGYVGDEADIILLGGTLHIEWNKENNNIYMTGPAEFVFDGEIDI